MEDRLDSKGTRANPKFVYLRCAGNGSRRDGIGRPAKWIASLTAISKRWSGVMGADEQGYGPNLWRRAGGMVG